MDFLKTSISGGFPIAITRWVDLKSWSIFGSHQTINFLLLGWIWLLYVIIHLYQKTQGFSTIHPVGWGWNGYDSAKANPSPFLWLNILGETSHEKFHPAGFVPQLVFGHPLRHPQWCLAQSQGMNLEHSAPYSRHLTWSWRLPSSGTGKQAASVSPGSGPKIVWEVSSGAPRAQMLAAQQCSAMPLRWIETYAGKVHGVASGRWFPLPATWPAQKPRYGLVGTQLIAAANDSHAGPGGKVCGGILPGKMRIISQAKIQTLVFGVHINLSRSHFDPHAIVSILYVCVCIYIYMILCTVHVGAKPHVRP